ncbi:MAG TPA: carbamoyl phosphate synthase small subunit [Limnochordia bacterium]|jgi:carbamoyl-phosphate synthase small subunit|nr:carbamoyl phosphate synthase small subunit [Peptococcaceae bacterium MAG4]NLW39211.1 carbamoyl phosphate synthase small subunit [Peptococcaceae bacterium]HUM59184.1 carbamoyl phosphate synthase small subunit [Bacillota bacterium]HXK98353.1 carbamoyl phosphate synthase small subunit [Limnochordia bacterium]
MGGLHLILENGMVFEGQSFGSEGDVTGEIVFTTGMTGYLETLTDQSYHGQIVLQTFPLIGNYGIIPSDFESSSVGPLAYIVKTPCQSPSNFRSEGTLDRFLKEKGVVGLYGIDTRALTRIIREHGVMNGRITKTTPLEVSLEEIRSYRIKNAVPNVSCAKPALHKGDGSKYTVALFDFGLKENIKRELLKRGCDVWVLPWDTSPEAVVGLEVDGIVLSNGPGDPADNIKIIQNLRILMQTGIPIFGICLGHQLLALASGFKTHKLKYGHRGANQPVKDLMSGRVYISSQNHGYAVTRESIDKRIAAEWFVNVNDLTCEGLWYKHIPAFSVQFHPEACGGPLDTAFLFDLFLERLGERKHAA